MVIDHERLQAAAWAEFHTARKRLDKATRDLHRHEEIDVPAYDSWLHRTFPILVTTLREFHAEVATKARKVQAVQARAAASGGSLKRLWRQQKERETNPDPPEADRESDDYEDEPSAGSRYEARPEDFERAPGPAPSLGAREIYRRLVQRLHPDRGGAWTPAREHLWHEVQRAWAAADTDWLSRLEVDWETANEIVSAASPLSRLRRAIEELHAARRDTERKLREYRDSPPWRFTRNEKNRAVLHRRTEANFAHDLKFLQRQLDYLNATIAAWEEDWTRPGSGPKSRHRRSRRY
jgi:phage/plasmid-associated DNA primase